MSGNIDSIEQLVQAEGLLERARKGGLAKQIEITQRLLDTRKGGGVAGAASNGLSSLNSFLGLGDGENDDSTPALEAKLAGLKARQVASQSLTVTTGETNMLNHEGQHDGQKEATSEHRHAICWQRLVSGYGIIDCSGWAWVF
jgi:hypothetical protein